MRNGHDSRDDEIQSLRQQLVDLQNNSTPTATRGRTRQFELEVETLKMAHEEKVTDLEVRLAKANRMLELAKQDAAGMAAVEEMERHQAQLDQATAMHDQKMTEILRIVHDKDDESPRRGVDSLKKPISRA